jgi:hypothetical protein
MDVCYSYSRQLLVLFWDNVGYLFVSPPYDSDDSYCMQGFVVVSFGTGLVTVCSEYCRELSDSVKIWEISCDIF